MVIVWWFVKEIIRYSFLKQRDTVRLKKIAEKLIKKQSAFKSININGQSMDLFSRITTLYKN